MVIKDAPRTAILDYFNKFPVDPNTDDPELKHQYNKSRLIKKLADNDTIPLSKKPSLMLKFIVNDLFRQGMFPADLKASASDLNAYLGLPNDDRGVFKPSHAIKSSLIPYSYDSDKYTDEEGRRDAPLYSHSKKGLNFFDSLTELPDDLKTWTDWDKWLRKQYYRYIQSPHETSMYTEDGLPKDETLLRKWENWKGPAKAHAPIEQRTPEYEDAHKAIVRYFNRENYPDGGFSEDPIAYNTIAGLSEDYYNELVNKAKAYTIKLLEEDVQAKEKYFDEKSNLDPNDPVDAKRLKKLEDNRRQAIHKLKNDLYWLGAITERNANAKTGDQQHADEVLNGIIRNKVVDFYREAHDIQPSVYSSGAYFHDNSIYKTGEQHKGNMLRTDEQRKAARQQYKQEKEYLKSGGIPLKSNKGGKE